MSDLDTSLDVEMDSVGALGFLNDSVDDVDAVYNVPLVAMTAVFRLKDITPGTRELGQKGSSEKIARPSVKFTLEIVDVIKCAPGADVPEDPEAAFKGRRLIEDITMIGDMTEKEFKGRIKGFVQDMYGKPFSGSFIELFEEAKDCEFRAEVRMRPDRNDKNIKYPYIKRDTKGSVVAV